MVLFTGVIHVNHGEQKKRNTSIEKHQYCVSYRMSEYIQQNTLKPFEHASKCIQNNV